MGLFRRKKDKIIDLSERYKKQQEKIAEMQSDDSTDASSSEGAFSFLGNLASGSSANSGSSETESSEYIDVSGADEKRRKLAKRLIDMTQKIEDISNQIYHLQQRIEVLEKKSGVGY